VKREKAMIVWDSVEYAEMHSDMSRFRAFAEQAAAAGATHVTLSQIPPSKWQRSDPRDPHPEWDSWPVWSRRAVGVFKLVLPPELAPWFPAEESRRNLALMEERCAILRSLGLRAIMDGHEPMWWPEGVFEEHPEWRGPQVECLPLARLAYFSPCVDHPEVLAMYRKAMAELCRRLPELDGYVMLTNDSSAGFCWAHTYPGENGPDACRGIALIDRISGFLSALQDGARDAGREIVVALNNSRLYLDNNRHYHVALKPGQYVDGRDRERRPFAAGVGSNSWFGSGIYPVLGVPRTLTFLEGLEKAFGSDTERVSVSFGSVAPLLVDIYKEFMARPSSGPASRMQLLLRVAATRVESDKAEDLLEVWTNIEGAVECIRYCLNGASLTLVGPLMMRWLIMPLVPDISRLTEDETRYFERGRVAKNTVEALSYHGTLGGPGITGRAAVGYARLVLSTAMSKLEAAAASTEDLTSHAADEKAQHELASLTRHLKVFRRVLLTCRNFIEYEYILTTRKRDDEEVWYRDQYGVGVLNRGGYELRIVARSEMDNAVALADLVEGSAEPVLAIAGSEEEEDALAFAPDLPDQLRRKARIMADHWREYNELYPPVPGVRQHATPAAQVEKEEE